MEEELVGGEKATALLNEEGGYTERWAVGMIPEGSFRYKSQLMP